jgi:hypothetical protein
MPNLSDLSNLLDVRWTTHSDVMTCGIAMWWHMQGLLGRNGNKKGKVISEPCLI